MGKLIVKPRISNTQLSEKLSLFAVLLLWGKLQMNKRQKGKNDLLWEGSCYYKKGYGLQRLISHEPEKISH